jgi:hypothetical protein
MDETQKALDDLKALISKPPILASLEPGGTLLLYVTATTQVISTAHVAEREQPWHVYKVQRPVYYISKVLSNCETLYNQGLKPHILTQETEEVHARLNTRARRWASEVPSVLWSLRTTPNRSTGVTPGF